MRRRGGVDSTGRGVFLLVRRCFGAGHSGGVAGDIGTSGLRTRFLQRSSPSRTGGMRLMGHTTMAQQFPLSSSSLSLGHPRSVLFFFVWRGDVGVQSPRLPPISAQPKHCTRCFTTQQKPPPPIAPLVDPQEMAPPAAAPPPPTSDDSPPAAGEGDDSEAADAADVAMRAAAALRLSSMGGGGGRSQQQPQQQPPLGTTTTANRMSEQQQQQQFKVTVIRYGQGGCSTIYLTPTELLKRTSILPRDLVSLHLTSRGEEQEQQQQKQQPQAQQFQKRRRTARPPTAIVPRTDCILLSFGNIRAIAGRESVYILDAHTKMASSFAKDLAAVYHARDNTPSGGDDDEHPELVFLEAVMRDTVDTYTRRIRIFEPIVDDFLGRAANEVFSESGVHQLVPLKDALQGFELQLTQSLDCLTSILNDDKLMLDLLLTEQAEARSQGVQVEFSRHEYVELMLSVYSRQIQNLQQEVQYLLSRLQSKQEFIALALAGYRNRLVRMNVHLGIMGVATGMMTATTGLFGMNLVSGLEESPMAFVMVTGGSLTVAMTVSGIYFSFLRGRILQERAAQSLAEIQTFVNSLSDMGALDYTVKKMMILQQQQQEEGGGGAAGVLAMDKLAFKNRLQEARMSGNVTDQEVDFLFGVLDTHKDNQLTPQDFSVPGDHHSGKT
jgi:hypothetical protein